jgi:hypothetical protein
MLSRDSHNGNMFLSLLIGRWLVLLPPAVTLLHPQQNPARTAWVFAAALCSNVMLSLWHRAINRQLVCHPWLLGLDMLSAATYIAFTGGTQSPYYFYATTPLLAASFFFKVRGGVLAALVFTPLYLVATVFALRMSGGNFDDVEALSEVLSFYGIALVFGYSAVLLDPVRRHWPCWAVWWRMSVTKSATLWLFWEVTRNTFCARPMILKSCAATLKLSATTCGNWRTC